MHEPKLNTIGSMMKVVYPGPLFQQRFLQVVVKVENGTTSKAVMFGVTSLSGESVTNDVWCFNLTDHYWTKAAIRNVHGVPERNGTPLSLSVAFRIEGENKFAVYGGVVPNFASVTVVNNVSVFEFLI